MAGLVMVAIDPRAVDRLLRGDETPHRAVALRHAATQGRPGLWVDDPARPSSVAWLREGDPGRWEAFAAGSPGPMIARLADWSGGRPIALMAPPSWEGPIRGLGGRLVRATVQTWLGPETSPRRPGPALARRLGHGDARAFEGLAPPWALRSWGDFGSMIGRGAAFGVDSGEGLASAAWTYESVDDFDKIGVATAEPFRRLGLGRAAASKLADHIRDDRDRRPLWVTHAGNPASIALACSLGFSGPTAEALLEWTPDRTGSVGLIP